MIQGKKSVVVGLLVGVLLQLNLAAQENVAAQEVKPPEVSFYGQIRVDAIYDTAEFNSAQSPIVVQKQPAGRTPGPEFDLHPRLTRVGTDVKDNLEEIDTMIYGKIEVDFQNGGPQSRELLRLRHAYIDFHKGEFSLLIGQTWQMVSRLIPLANGDTLMWGVGNTGDRTPQMRASYRVPFSDESAITFEAGLQQIGTVDSKGQAGTNFGDAPAYQGRIAIDMPIWTKKAFHAAFAVHQGTEILAEKAFGKDHFEQYGVFTEIIVPIVDGFDLRGEYFQGKNISDLRGGIVFGINTVTDEEIPTKGYWAEARLDAITDYLFAVGYGKDNPDNRYVVDGYPSLNEASWVVAHYNMTADIRIGLEYLKWATEYKNDQRLTSDRVVSHIVWSF